MQQGPFKHRLHSTRIHGITFRHRDNPKCQRLKHLFTKHHITNKCTNCMSFILNHFFKTLFTAPTCFDSISLITRNNVHKYRVSTLHNLILTFHIFTIMVLTINIILNTDNTIYYYLQICCHNNIITKKFIF